MEKKRNTHNNIMVIAASEKWWI